MTTINDISDLLRILNEQPEWADQVRAALLGQRYLELPDRVDDLTKAVEELASTVREMSLAFDRRLTRLEEDMVEVKTNVAELRSDMVEVKAEVTGLKSDMVEVKADVAELKSDMVEVKAEVTGLKSDMVEVKTDVAGLKSDMVEVKADGTSLKAAVARIEDKLDRHDRTFSTLGGHVDRLRGHDFEGVAVEPARRKLRDELSMSNLSVFSQNGKHNADRIENLARDARIAGTIGDDDQAALTLADVTYEGTKDGEQVFVLAEISITVEVDDVERAAHRASILRQATGVPSLAAVIGASIEADAAREADRNSVAYAQVPEE